LQEEYKQAVEEQMATNNPMHSMLHLNYALLLENTATTIDQLEMADKYYEKAVDIGIDEQQNRVDVVPHVALNRAHMLYHRLRDIPRAEKWYRLALSREPENAACAYALAQFSYCVALENYHKRTRKLLYSSTPVVLTARDFRAKNGLEETKRLFKKVKKDLSKDPEVLFIVACFHRELGEVDAARQLFKRSLKNSDKESIVNVEPFATTPFYRKQVYATFLVDHVMPKEEDEECKLELKERALELLKGARVESENAPITILKHATILIKMQEDSEKIERCFKFVMKKNGTSSSNFYWRYSDFLWKCVGESRYEDARAMYEQALELERQRPKAWREMQYAMFLWKKNEGAKKETLACKNDFKGAYEHFVKANDLDPNNPELLRHFSQFLLGVYNDKKIAFGLYFNSLKARPGDYDLAMGCASYMKEIKSWRKADYAFGRACSIVDNVGFEGTEEERVAAHYEYGLFLIKVRQQFRRAHDHFIIAGKHDGVVDLYNEGQTMFDKVETLYKTGLIGARENEIMDINNQITLENETPQPKGQKGKKVKKDLLDSAQDKTIYRYRKGLADFLDRVANKPEDSLQQLFLCQVQRADKDVLYTLARVKVKTDDFLGAFTFLEKSIDAGFKDVVMFESDPELTQLKDGSKEGGNSEKYMECLTRVKVPPSQRDINVGASKMVKGRKKKKGK
jgi:tetratricopeptide (TPR) repeat protein